MRLLQLVDAHRTISESMFAAIHVHPAISLSLSAPLLIWIAWYWARLGGKHVPATRRRIRRTSLALMLLAWLAILLGLSFVDPALHQREYIIVWSAALLLIAIIMVVAGIDAMNTLRLAQQQGSDALRDAASELAQAIRDRRSEQAAERNHLSKRNGEIRS